MPSDAPSFHSNDAPGLVFETLPATHFPQFDSELTHEGLPQVSLLRPGILLAKANRVPCMCIGRDQKQCTESAKLQDHMG
jgi:hypothetical protein